MLNTYKCDVVVNNEITICDMTFTIVNRQFFVCIQQMYIECEFNAYINFAVICALIISKLINLNSLYIKYTLTSNNFELRKK